MGLKWEMGNGKLEMIKKIKRKAIERFLRGALARIWLEWGGRGIRDSLREESPRPKGRR